MKKLGKKDLAKLILGIGIEIKIRPIISLRDTNIVDKVFSYFISASISSIVSNYMVEAADKYLIEAPKKKGE